MLPLQYRPAGPIRTDDQHLIQGHAIDLETVERHGLAIQLRVPLTLQQGHDHCMGCLADMALDQRRMQANCK